MDVNDHKPNRRFRLTVQFAIVAIAALLVSACGKTSQAPPVGETQAGAAQTGTTEPASEAPSGPAPAITQASWTPDALEKLVAPIALYPDQLLGQILAASVNSQEVLDGGNWLLQNQDLKGEQLDAAAQKAGFGPPMRALVQFPTVVDMMCEQIDWTRQLGTAFTSDQKSVLDAVQTLRAQAQKVGNLRSTPQQKVETKTDNGKTVIEVQPAEPTVIYVPQYNPTVVYTTPPPPAPPPTSTVSTGAAVATGLLAFGVGVIVGNAMSDNYCYPHWGAGAVYVGPRPFYPPAYVYRPVYGPAFRPAYGYAPPPGYRYGYNNVNVNRNVNVNVNNNYFNQFNHNQNLRVNNTQNLGGATQRNPGEPNWKGQSTYAGAHGNNLGGRTANPALSERSNTPGRTGGNLGTPASQPGQRNNALARNSQPGTRPAAAGAAANPPRAMQNRPNEAQATNRSPQQNPGGAHAGGLDRGFGGSNRPDGSAGLGASQNAAASRPGGSADVRGVGGHQGAFSGNQSGGGGFERASSARGHASAGGRQFAGHGGRR